MASMRRRKKPKSAFYTNWGDTKNKDFWKVAGANKLSWHQYYDRLTQLSISMFDWEGMPDTVDLRYLELVLYTQGCAIFFKDEVLGYLCLPIMVGGEWDIYDVPTRRRAYSTNGYQNELTPENSVIIWNNYLRTPSFMDIELFAKRLFNIDRTVDINVNAQKTPILITCEESQRLTVKNMYMKYEGNEPVIWGDKNLNPNSMNVLKTDAPFVANDLLQTKNQIWNEALTYLGIANINVQKKERLVTDEVSRNMGGVYACRFARLNPRQEACDAINRMFGLNVSVKYRDTFESNEEGSLGEDRDYGSRGGEGNE